MKIIATTIFTVSLFLCLSCNNTPVIEVESKPGEEIKERLINANKYIASSERTQIEGYIARRGWVTTTLPCGAEMLEYERGDGSAIDYDDTVTILYTLQTLSGATIYSDEEQTVIAGRREVAAGVDEALKRLRAGSKAHIVVPSEAGYGVAGDGDRIPSRTVLVYDLHVKAVKK